MAQTALSYQLGVDIQNALKEVDRFAKETKAKLEKEFTINLNMRSNGARGGLVDPFKEEMDKVEREQKASVARIEHLKQSSYDKLARMELASSVSISDIRQRAEVRIASIMENSGNLQFGEVQRQVNREIALYKSAAKERTSFLTSSRQTGGSGRALMVAFQTQQMVEDFSYAGLRGAGNNAAFMAASLGGPAGLIALIGLMGATLTPTVAKLLGFGDATNMAASETDRLNESVADLLQNDWSQWYHSGEFLSPEDIEKKRVGIGGLKNELNGLRLDYQNLVDVRDRLNHLDKQLPGFIRFFAETDAAGFPGPLADVENVQKFRELLQSEVKSLKTIAPDVNWDAILNFDGFNPQAVIEKINKALLENQAAQEGLAKTIRQSSDALKDADIAASNLLAKQKDIRAAFGLMEGQSYSSAYVESLMYDDESKIRLNQIKEQIRILEGKIQAAQSLGDIDGADQADGQIRKLIREQRTLTDAAEALKDAEKEALESAKEKLRTAEQQNKEYEREIDQIKKVIDKLKEAKAESKLEFGVSSFDTGRSMSKNKNNFFADYWKKYYGVDQSPNEHYKQLVGGKIDSYFNAVAEAEEKALNKQQVKFLKDQANAAGKAGDFDQQKSILEKLQSFQMSQAGSAKNPWEAQQWLDAAHQTQAEILALYDKQAAAEAKKLDNLKGQIESVFELKSAIEELEKAAKDVPQVDLKDPALIPWLIEVEERLKRLKALGGGGQFPNAPMGGFGGNTPKPWEMVPDSPSPFSVVSEQQHNFWPDHFRDGKFWDSLYGGGWEFPHGGGEDFNSFVPRAAGGPVRAGKGYMVGENGPEFIIPQTTGMVLDAKSTRIAMAAGLTALSAGGGNTVNNQSNQTTYAAPIIVQVSTAEGSLAAAEAAVRRGQAGQMIRQGR